MQPADLQFGYEFGCDGVADVAETRELLGNASVWTLNRRVEAGAIRKGKDGCRMVFCRRSIRDHIATMEQ